MLVKMLGDFRGKVIRALWDRKQGPVRVSPELSAKKALLSYIVSPFSPAAKVLHCNHVEAVGMAAVLHRMGYEVHAVDYKSTKPIAYDHYDLVIGFGQPFVNSYAAAGFTGKRIIYLTGASPDFSNRAEAFRLQALQRRRGMLLRPRREVYWPWCHVAINADGIIVTGNRWTTSTYAPLRRTVEAVPVPHVSPDNLVDDVLPGRGSEGLTRFIWFSGAGAVHKGLDLVLEAMDITPDDWRLDVCGPIAAEHDFMDLYRDYLQDHKKITYHGFIEPGSEAFREIVGRNAFVVFPSCSEGGASSVITCMAYGLIPIVTEESSIDAGGLEIKIGEATPSAVLDAMKQASMLPSDERALRARALRRRVHECHSAAAYEAAFADAVARILMSLPDKDQERQ